MKNKLVSREEIGERLVRLRGIRTRVGVARSLGISGPQLAFYERGQRNTPDAVKVALADFYGVSVQELFFA